jgi:AraC family transcriptional regulator of adaptative response/methylated-DNA-[protein]-cysteine methyltransferase
MTHPHIIIDTSHPIEAIKYSFAQLPFGDILIATTAYGICSLAFYTDKEQAVEDLQAQFPHIPLLPMQDSIQQALSIFQHRHNTKHTIRLHIQGTEFQLRVWQALLSIPFGQMTTYQEIARQIGKPKASRAVGTAIGSNSVAFFIPCHRVISSSGTLGGYKWGLERKAQIIEWERAMIERVSLI